jgi:hypothetical protein
MTNLLSYLDVCFDYFRRRRLASAVPVLTDCVGDQVVASLTDRDQVVLDRFEGYLDVATRAVVNLELIAVAVLVAKAAAVAIQSKALGAFARPDGRGDVLFVGHRLCLLARNAFGRLFDGLTHRRPVGLGAMLGQPDQVLPGLTLTSDCLCSFHVPESFLPKWQKPEASNGVANLGLGRIWQAVWPLLASGSKAVWLLTVGNKNACVQTRPSRVDYTTVLWAVK